MKTRVLTTTAALALALGMLAGCTNDNTNEAQRVVCEVEAVNGGAPLVSAYVIDGGDGAIGSVDGNPPDDLYTQDAVLMQFHARPYSTSSMTIPEDSAYSSFIITGYNLTWVPSATAPATLNMAQYNLVDQPFYLQVPINDDAESAILVVTREMKEAIIVAQGGPWNFDQDFTAAMRLEFVGHDSGSQHEVTVDAGLLVSFTYAASKD